MKILCAILILIFTAGNVLGARAKPRRHKAIPSKTHKAQKKNIKQAPYAVSLKGSHAAVRKQNLKADEMGLERIKNDVELERLKKEGLLVPLPENEFIRIDERLDKRQRWCLPWVRDWLLERGNELSLRGSDQYIQINSAVRTIEDQKKLMRVNRNAISPFGPLASTHTTGATIDIAKKEMSPKARAWLRNTLLNMERDGLLEATEERHQPVFHVMIYKQYSENPRKN